MGLQNLKNFEGFSDYFFNNLHKFQNIIERENPLEQILPGEWNTHFSSFEKLLIYKAIRPD